MNKPFIFLIVLLSSLLVPVTTPSFAQEMNLSPQLQKSFKKGLRSAEREKWKRAIKYFKVVQAEHPDYPPVLFNLGLAYARQGHSLPAIALLNAYLASDPNAENAQAIEGELIDLELALEDKIQKVFAKAIVAAEALPANRQEEGKTYVAHPRNSALNAISYGQAGTGDIEGALETHRKRTKEEYESGIDQRSFYIADWVEKLIELGDCRL